MDEYPIIDLSHLLPAAQGLARLPADERIQRLRADRWIGYPRAVEALNRLEALYAWPNKQRMPNLLLVGPTNNGKSMIVEKFRRTHPASSDADQEHIPVLVVQMPSEPSVIRFYVALLAAMGAPLRPRPRLPEMEQLALALLRKVGVRMLVIDELHNVLAGNSVNRREFLNLLRFLGNELRIPLVGVGTRDAYLAIRSDDQLENRFEPMMLPVWEANDDCCSLLASFAASLPLGGADDFLDGLYGHQSDRMTILDGTTPAKRHFDAALVVPVDIGIDSRHEVFQRHVLPIPRVD